MDDNTAEKTKIQFSGLSSLKSWDRQNLSTNILIVILLWLPNQDLW